MKLLDYKPGELFAKHQAYLAADAQYCAVYDYTQQQFKAAVNLSAHNWEHIYRDTLNAIVIGEAEGADMHIVLPAITMHDIGFFYGATGKTHGRIGADHVNEYLRLAKIIYLNEDVIHIASCIRTHKGSMLNEKPMSLEAKVIADADLLEKFGPFGVYQEIRTFTEFNWSLETFLERKDVLMGLTLETNTGKQLAEPGRQFAIGFYNALDEATQPYRNR